MSHHEKRMVDTARRNAYSHDDQTVANVRAELQRVDEALTLYESLDPEKPCDIIERVRSIATAYDALKHLDRWLPRPFVWCCGYAWGTEDRAYSVFSGHTTEAAAKRWLLYWEKEVPSREGRWEVTYRQTDITDLRDGPPPKLTTERGG